MKLSNAILSLAISSALLSVSALRAADEKPVKDQTKEEIEASLVTRVYSLQELNSPTVDFPLSTSTYQRAFIAPSGQSTASSYGAVAATNPTLFGGGAPSGESKTIKLSPADTMIKMIEEFVAPDSWLDSGGATGRVREVNGVLVIRQTEVNHAKIAALLNDVLSEQRGMVRVSADWLLLPPAEAVKIGKPGSGGAEEALTVVDAAAFKSLPQGARHFSGQTVSRSGQTVYLVSGLDRSLVTSATPVVSTGIGAYSADVSHVGSGLALEVNSRVNWDQHSALITVASTFSDPIELGTENSALSAATTQPASMSLMLLPSAVGVQPFSRAVQDMHTTIKLPLGTPVIAGSMTLKPDTKGSDEQVLVLILKVTASR